MGPVFLADAAQARALAFDFISPLLIDDSSHGEIIASDQGVRVAHTRKVVFRFLNIGQAEQAAAVHCSIEAGWAGHTEPAVALLHRIPRVATSTRLPIATADRWILAQDLQTAALLAAAGPGGLNDYRPEADARLVAHFQRFGADSYSCDDACGRLGVSRDHFRRMFSRTFETTTRRFLLYLRLRLAAKLLRTSQMPIKSIASEAGYQERANFARAFYRTLAATPRQYRNWWNSLSTTNGNNSDNDTISPQMTSSGFPDYDINSF